MDPKVETTNLDNGLAVTTVALPHLHTAVCALYLKVGARFEAPADNGLSHFVEHMMFRGTERYPDSLALNTAVERIGSTLDAQTGRDYTLFQLGLPPECVAEGIGLLGELLARPRFDDIELERALVLEEINEDYDEQGVEINADDIARGLAFEHHPLGQRIIGPRTNVERFTSADVRRHWQTFYGATNANLCVAGPVEHAEVVAAASAHLAAMQVGQRAIIPPAPAHHAGPLLRHVNDAGSQTSLAVLFRAVPEIDPTYLSLVALQRVLDDGMSTRLHYTLADQKGLAYSIHAAVEPLVDATLFEIAGATANAKVPALARELLALLDGLRAGQITNDELARVRTRYRYETLAMLDDPQAMAGWYGGTALYFPAVPPSERLAAISAITVDNVIEMAKKVLTPDHLVLAAVGSLSKARLGELRSIVNDWR